MGALRTAAALAQLNQRNGFDCDCAWRRSPADAKLARTAPGGRRKRPPSVPSLQVLRSARWRSCPKPEYWLSQQGRLAHPMVLRPGDDHYRPISWDARHIS